MNRLQGNRRVDEPLHIPIRRVRADTDEDLPLPLYMTPRAAGMDLFAAVDEPLTLQPREIVLVPTGVALALPEGFEGQIRARSGLASSHGIAVINAPGTVDSDYRGEVKVALVNLGNKPFTISRGDRIAQMVITRVYRAHWVVRETLDETERNERGFGHTGVLKRGEGEM
ncbi:MAG: dUTP diphosphatase [Syntrophobacteria bacterium]